MRYLILILLIFIVLTTVSARRKSRKGKQEGGAVKNPNPLLTGKPGATILELPVSIPLNPDIGALFAIAPLAKSGGGKSSDSGTTASASGGDHSGGLKLFQ